LLQSLFPLCVAIFLFCRQQCQAEPVEVMSKDKTKRISTAIGAIEQTI